MYTSQNFASKAALKRHLADPANPPVTVFQPNDFFGNPKTSPTYSGSVTLEGPWLPKPHTWYGVGSVVDGVLVSVK